MTDQENRPEIKVVDRRTSTREKQDKVDGPGWEMREKKEHPALPPLDFTTFCLSLASSAMIHLGQRPSPETGEADANLPLAKQTVDILAMIEEKTRGNLNDGEAKLLSTVLYDLRLRYLESKQK